ncbi:hypothetical protein BU16DRAFT_367699 [Lophium mytilinum]|uniref:Uncharacterized protein n=1 Tax=Lophium mytilinum TaxID=390894 RepID=A0A6A6QUE9_9PEZI|nr:hypothetical protein BU16DRAFT_367699 [Lophium mytilinum]
MKKQYETHTRLYRGQHGRDACEFRIEIAGIGRAGDLRLERRSDALVVDVVPVDVPEESVAHNLLRVRWARSQSQFGLAGEQFLKNRHRITRHVDRVQGFVGKNSVVDFVFILTAEWRLLEKHLVDEDAKCPPVYSAAVLLVKQDLGAFSILARYINIKLV